ncbi:DUF4249 domain-containing protein [Algoriphagus sp. CAU 1675]|uniref:DUF4249 domain-containing protein n=1 Tax=Algoriphagus sp. CAU 1675 TaxID=3032597 RepID=UPI0023DADB60|nr:DUF4249 domain-containing protein [Algoriphagus sp. CAU 1675]MDF2158817.1 DUF4249 domain-containing protein [Algoriphagus sp. CAU 1675]
MFKRFIYLLLLVPVACIDPYEVDIEEGEQLLTVEGIVTTQPGPHRIRLTKSDTYGSVFEGLIRPVTGATVIIRDDLGEVIFLEENAEERGAYYTPSGFSAVIGRSYSLQIQTQDGKVYTSLPEKVEDVPQIKDLSVATLRIPVEGETNDRSGIQVIAEIDDPVEENNFYLWQNGPSVYVLETRPDLYTPRPSDTNPSRDPQPKPCCITCFRSEDIGNQSVFIAQDDNFNGLTTQIPVAFIEDDGLRFVNTYRIDIRQIGISQEAYRFLKLVKQQVEISGSVFDPPPATIRGNMINLENPEEVILGYFIVGAEDTKRLYIDKNDLTFAQNVAIIPDDCREVEGAQLDPPADWNP